MTPVPPGIPRAPRPRGGVPLERGRAAGMLVGLLVFGLGFVVAAVAGLTGTAGGPLYLSGIGVGFFGVGVVAFFLNRGTVPLPDQPIWSRVGLSALAEALGLPALAVMVAVYALIGAGILGNVVFPLLQS